MSLNLHLLGARGTLGRILASALSGIEGSRIRKWSGEPGDRNYREFIRVWSRRRDEGRTLVIVGGGHTEGDMATLVRDHIDRVAALVDEFDRDGWPDGVLLLGSAAELVPTSRYGAVKRAQRSVLEIAARSPEVPVVCLRLHSVVPKSRPTRGLFAELLTQFERGGEVRVRHLSGARDYLSADQVAIVCRCLVLEPVAMSRAARRETVDVGNGQAVRVEDWLDAFRTVFGPEERLEVLHPGFQDAEVVADVDPLLEILAASGSDFPERYQDARRDLAEYIRDWVREGST